MNEKQSINAKLERIVIRVAFFSGEALGKMHSKSCDYLFRSQFLMKAALLYFFYFVEFGDLVCTYTQVIHHSIVVAFRIL